MNRLTFKLFYYQLKKTYQRSLLASILICSMFLVVPAHTSPLNVTEPISLRFQDAPIRVILQALADHQHLNLAVADSVTGQLTIRLDNVEWDQAIDVVLHLARLDMEIHNGVMLILPQEEKRLRKQQNDDEQDKLKQKQSLSLLKIKIINRDSNDIINILNQYKGSLLSDNAQLSAESQTNQILIYDYSEQLPAIKSFIQDLDQPQKQVQITAHIVTMSHEGLAELGVKWGLSDHSSTGINNLNINLGLTTPTSQAGFNIAKLSGRLLSLELSALEQENQVDIIASPRLLTANNQLATIKQGTELPYEVASGSNGATAIEFKSAVLGLEVTPKILPDHKVHLALQISQNTPGRTIKQSNGGEVLAIDTQEIKTQVIVANNETLVLGGVFQQSSKSSTERVPLLGSIPILGGLFSRDSQQQSKRQLIIFITPTLVDI